MLLLQAFVLSANQPLKNLASCLSRDTQSTSQTQMKPSRNTSLCHLEQASIQDRMHKGCAAISQYSSIVLSVVKLALISAFAMKPLLRYPYGLIMYLTDAAMICNDGYEKAAES